MKSSGLLAASSHTRNCPVPCARRTQQVVHMIAHTSLDCRRPDTVLRGGFGEENSFALRPLACCLQGLVTIAEILMVRENDMWSRQRCVLIPCKNSSQLCNGPISRLFSTLIGDSFRKLVDDGKYTCWGLYLRCLKDEKHCVNACDPHDPDLAFCWPCLYLPAARSEAESSKGQLDVL